MALKLRLILCILVQVICILKAQDYTLLENTQLQVSLTPNGRVSHPRGSRLTRLPSTLTTTTTTTTTTTSTNTKIKTITPICIDSDPTACKQYLDAGDCQYESVAAYCPASCNTCTRLPPLLTTTTTTTSTTIKTITSTSATTTTTATTPCPCTTTQTSTSSTTTKASTRTLCNGYYVNYQCISCFCNGLPVKCRGAGHLYYNKEQADFTGLYHDWEVKELQTNTVSKDVKTDTRKGEFKYTGSYGAWYFNVPSRFKGNRLKSYGGELRFNIYYEGVINENNEPLPKLIVKIRGSKFSLIYVHNEAIYPYKVYEIVIPLVEASFKRTIEIDANVSGDHDDDISDHDRMLMTLATVDLIMITASFVSDQHISAISKFNFDYAKNWYDARQKMANLVEICECPSDYSGTSCENCNKEFFKSNFGRYLGSCATHDCQEFCNGNSYSCDERKCYNCENNTTGDRCEACAPGYGGNAKNSRCFKRRL